MKALFALVLASCLAAAAHAAAPTPESVEKLLTLMETEKSLDAIRPHIDGMMKTSMQQATKGNPVSPEQQKVLDNFREKVSAIVQRELTMAKLKPLYVDIYTKNFTQDEIDGLITFYMSPAGKAYVAKMPAVMQSIMTEMPGRLNPMMEQIQQAAQEMGKQLGGLKKAQEK